MHEHDHSSTDCSPDSHAAFGRRDLLRSAVVLGIGAAGATIAAPAAVAAPAPGPAAPAGSAPGAAPARTADAPPSLA
ncbi:hypothetical protein ACFV9Q_12915, partial [Promicromonospora sp. NPDC059942]